MLGLYLKQMITAYAYFIFILFEKGHLILEHSLAHSRHTNTGWRNICRLIARKNF